MMDRALDPRVPLEVVLIAEIKGRLERHPGDAPWSCVDCYTRRRADAIGAKAKEEPNPMKLRLAAAALLPVLLAAAPEPAPSVQTPAAAPQPTPTDQALRTMLNDAVTQEENARTAFFMMKEHADALQAQLNAVTAERDKLKADAGAKAPATPAPGVSSPAGKN